MWSIEIANKNSELAGRHTEMVDPIAIKHKHSLPKPESSLNTPPSCVTCGNADFPNDVPKLE